MARFNVRTKVEPDTVNREGSPAYAESPKLAMVSLMLTSFLKSQFYRGADQTEAELLTLVGQVPPKFAAKAALFARDRFGMRSVSHVVAGTLAKTVKGERWTAGFFDKVIVRPDDMLEIAAYYAQANGGLHPFPNSLKRGFGRAFGRMDSYRLGKYRGQGKTVSMIDLVNLVRPKPTERNKAALEGIVKGTLRQTGTWEDELTKAGQADDKDKDTAKAEVWRDLIESGKIGYFALLRNLRNIMQQAPDVLPQALELLVDEERISKSRVLPFRYMSAYWAIRKEAGPSTRPVMTALAQAIDVACRNVSELPGRTLVAMDCSGSMDGMGGSMWQMGKDIKGDGKSPREIGALFASVLYRSQVDCDVMMFSTSAAYKAFVPTDSAISMTEAMTAGYGGGTDFRPILKAANRPYERIIILTDMQAWVGYHTPEPEFREYCRKHGCQPHLYCWDLQGYGSLQFPENKIYSLAGWSDKAFDLMPLLEEDREALVHAVEAVEL